MRKDHNTLLTYDPGQEERTMKPKLEFQRRELKYYLPEPLYPDLISLISPYMTLDRYLDGSESKSYVVRSLYLDTEDLRFYHEKLDGLENRRKFRVRGYNNERSGVFFEIKRRYNDIIVKDRSFVDYEEMGGILDLYGGYYPNGNGSNGKSKVINSFLFFIPALQLRPKVLIAYDREAYTGVFDDSVRLTMDRNLRCLPGGEVDLFYSGTDWMFINGRCILELKFNYTLPSFFGRVIKRLNLWTTSISKYCSCIEKCGEFI